MTEPSSPAEALARRIAARLAAEHVIADADVDAMARRLAAGELKQRDWETIVDGGSLGTPPNATTPPF